MPKTPSSRSWWSLSALLALPALVSAAPQIEVTASTLSVALYEPLILSIRTTAAFKDPFDPADIAVDALVHGPRGDTLVLPCFFRSGTSGNSSWEARFAPRRTGPHAYRVAVKTRIEEGESTVRTVEALPGTGEGFLSLEEGSHFAFRFDSGRMFRGVGSNFNSPSGSFSNERMMGLFKQHRMTFMRTWSGPGTYNIESKSTTAGTYQESEAAKVDSLLSLARRNGVYLMSAFDTFGKYLLQDSKFGGGGSWNSNVYSRSKGGPAGSPTEFLKDPKTRELYKRRLRYAVARWAYHPNLAVWEFWNEVDHLIQYSSVVQADITSWHAEMGAYLKRIDPYRHPVSTSMSWAVPADLWKDPGMDITQMHLYQSTDNLAKTIAKYEADYAKPFVAGEFSLHWEGTNQSSAASYERELHMGLWRGLFSPTPVLPLTWWWDFHYGQGDFVHFSRLGEFLEGMPSHGPAPVSVTVQAPADLEALAIRMGPHVFVWLHNKKGSTLQKPVVTLPGLDRPEYLLTSFEPWSGTKSMEAMVRPAGGVLRIEAPDLGADKEMAYRIMDRNPLVTEVRRGRERTGYRVRALAGRLLIEMPAGPGSGVDGTVRYSLRDQAGRLVMEGKVSLHDRRAQAPAEAVMDISALRPGIYLLGYSVGSFNGREAVMIRSP